MASRTLLCVEPDPKDVEFVREVLAPHGFEVKCITNGEQAIEWARKNQPSVIIVCVEPRKVGYAVCNKIKRSPELKDVPLILTSSEETPQTFEQHKKLRSRAEDYIIKPLQRAELLNKVKALVGLANGGPVTREGSSEDSEEISIGENDIVEEQRPVVPVVPITGNGNNGAARMMVKNPDLDAIFDQETEAAFAAIQTEDAESRTGPVRGTREAAPSPWDPDEWNAEATQGNAAAPLPFIVPQPAPTPMPTSAPPPQTRTYGFDADVPPSPDDVMHPVASNDISGPLSLGSTGEARLRELQARLLEVERDKHRFEGEAEELRSRLAAQPISKEKDILALREIINRKEKDSLDLRDELDAKERQILDHKDRVRENERARRDLEEKIIGFEKSLVSANERVNALSHDKEKATERERGLKGRLDDALTEIQKAHEEVDALKRKLVATEERARADLDRMRGDLEGRLAEQEQTHRAELAHLAEERALAEANREREHQAELTRLEAARLAELEGTQKRLGDELSLFTERSKDELGKARRDHDKALSSLKEEHVVQLAAERQAHQTAIENKERDHRNEILGMRRRHEEELSTAEDKRQKELAEAESRRVADLEAAETRRRTEVQTRDEEHHALVAEMDRRHFDEKTEMGERHRGEQDQANARAARAEGELAARNEELSEAHRRLSAREADLDALRADVRERDVKLAQSRDRTAELEAKTSELEDQVLRAYQKLRVDERTLDKAKRALAVALNLLDGGGAVAQPAPPTVTGPTPTPAPGITPARSEESST
jgi:CheY-like chemotaxis protein